MTKIENTFSLSDLRKKTDKVQIYDERTMDDEGNIFT